ncbi:MAG: hypothetical protein ACYC6Y_16720 [Thermoguttaceae bacterium]
MTRGTSLLLGAFLLALFFADSLIRADDSAPAAAEEYLLRYKFQPGECVRWRVEHLAKIKSTVAGTTETTETVSKSIKAWKVTGVDNDGTATFENLVEQVDMRTRFTGRQEVVYNSQTDATPPPGYEDVARSIGKRLSLITINSRGEVVARKDEKMATTSPNEGQVTMTLPKDPVAVGATWSFPFQLVIPANNQTVVKIDTQQKYTFESVKNGVAQIRMVTAILTPIHDPTIEVQLIQRQIEGTIRFDIQAGRVLGQQMDLDKSVVGFAGRNDTSSLHYLTRFTEELVTETPQADEVAGADAPAKTATKLGDDDGERK